MTGRRSCVRLGAGAVRVATAARRDSAVGRRGIQRLKSGRDAFLERNADKGWKTVADFRGIRRDRVVLQSQIRRPEGEGYQGGYEPVEGYAAPDAELMPS